MITAEQITETDAEDAWESKTRMDESGTIGIDGHAVDWWSGQYDVWFYLPGNSGEDTLKRFTAVTSLRAV